MGALEHTHECETGLIHEERIQELIQQCQAYQGQQVTSAGAETNPGYHEKFLKASFELFKLCKQAGGHPGNKLLEIFHQGDIRSCRNSEPMDFKEVMYLIKNYFETWLLREEILNFKRRQTGS